LCLTRSDYPRELSATRAKNNGSPTTPRRDGHELRGGANVYLPKLWEAQSHPISPCRVSICRKCGDQWREAVEQPMRIRRKTCWGRLRARHNGDDGSLIYFVTRWLTRSRGIGRRLLGDVGNGQTRWRGGVPLLEPFFSSHRGVFQKQRAGGV
jgi:hypothetical protein